MLRCAAPVLVLSVTLAACGGGHSNGQRKAPAGTAQIAAWEDATHIFDREFQDCGRRIYPTRHFYAACMKQPFADYDETAAAVRRACKGRQLDAAVAAVHSLQRKEVRLADAPLDAYLSHRRYRGPPLIVVEMRTRREIARRIGAVHRLGTAACTAP
jgi:hypothetical protein